MLRKICVSTGALIFISAIFLNAFAEEAGVKPSYDPIVIFLLDSTNTMKVGPDGTYDTRWGTSTACTGSFSATKTGSYTTDCSRMAIAQRVIFDVLDYDRNGKVNDTDKANWKLRIGAANYEWLHGTTINYVNTKMLNVTKSYQEIMCNTTNKNTCLISVVNAGQCLTHDTADMACLADRYNLDRTDTGAGTNTTWALEKVKAYLDTLNGDTDDNKCRKKYIVLITDGTDNKAYYGTASNYTDCRSPGPCSDVLSKACVGTGTYDGTTYNGGSGYDCKTTQTVAAHIWRREMVLKAKELATKRTINSVDYGPYKVFVVGFAKGLKDYHKNTLNWMALWGDPESKESLSPFSTAAIKPSSIGAIRTSACVYNDPIATISEAACGAPDTGDINVNLFYAADNDPGNQSFATFSPTKDYAYFSDNSAKLASDLRGILGAIFSENYSFTASSVQAVRDDDESYVYEASFEYVSNDPFRIGHLKRYGICTKVEGECTAIGDIKASADWDAGLQLLSRETVDTSTARTIQTYIGGSQVAFNTTNVTKTYLGVDQDTEAAAIVTFIRGGDKGYPTSDSHYGWKLGDISNSSPLMIGPPNALFFDQWDYNSTTKTYGAAYAAYRSSHLRSTVAAKSPPDRLLLQGANDGQLHVFKAASGYERWSFIPPNFLPLFKDLAHTGHPASDYKAASEGDLLFQYFVDGQTSAAEIWIDTGTSTLCQEVSSVVTCNGAQKTEAQWHTYFVLSEGRGAPGTLWSSSTHCDTGFSSTYSSTFNNYCGYWAFDISDTAKSNVVDHNPTLAWRIGGKAAGLNAQNGMHLAQPWSKMFIGRVRVSNKEKWVGLIGGGFSGGDSGEYYCQQNQACAVENMPGKAFYVVNMNDGSILWSTTRNTVTEVSGVYTYATATEHMDYDLAAPPAAIDSDGDGFMDVAYAPDVKGNVWRFRFCTKAMDASRNCGTSNWSASLLYYNSSEGTIQPIYTAVSAAKDPSGQIWVYFGTGDKVNPNAPNAQEYFFAVKEKFGAAISGTSTLFDATSATYDATAAASKENGWYMKLSGTGAEKILASPVVFEGGVYFASYTPRKNNDACDYAGQSTLYGVNYMTGAGLFDTGTVDEDGNTIYSKSKDLGEGLVTGLVPSRGKDGWNLYAFRSSEPHTFNVPDIPQSNATNSSIIYWHDRRVR